MKEMRTTLPSSSTRPTSSSTPPSNDYRPLLYARDWLHQIWQMRGCKKIFLTATPTKHDSGQEAAPSILATALAGGGKWPVEWPVEKFWEGRAQKVPHKEREDAFASFHKRYKKTYFDKIADGTEERYAETLRWLFAYVNLRRHVIYPRIMYRKPNEKDGTFGEDHVPTTRWAAIVPDKDDGKVVVAYTKPILRPEEGGKGECDLAKELIQDQNYAAIPFNIIYVPLREFEQTDDRGIAWAKGECDDEKGRDRKLCGRESHHMSMTPRSQGLMTLKHGDCSHKLLVAKNMIQYFNRMGEKCYLCSFVEFYTAKIFQAYADVFADDFHLISPHVLSKATQWENSSARPVGGPVWELKKLKKAVGGDLRRDFLEAVGGIDARGEGRRCVWLSSKNVFNVRGISKEHRKLYPGATWDKSQASVSKQGHTTLTPLEKKRLDYTRNLVAEFYNLPANKSGELISAVFGDATTITGLSYYDTPRVIMLHHEPKSGNRQQALGRVTRVCSLYHQDAHFGAKGNEEGSSQARKHVAIPYVLMDVWPKEAEENRGGAATTWMTDFGGSDVIPVDLPPVKSATSKLLPMDQRSKSIGDGGDAAERTNKEISDTIIEERANLFRDVLSALLTKTGDKRVTEICEGRAAKGEKKKKGAGKEGRREKRTWWQSAGEIIGIDAKDSAAMVAAGKSAIRTAKEVAGRTARWARLEPSASPSKPLVASEPLWNRGERRYEDD